MNRSLTAITTESMKRGSDSFIVSSDSTVNQDLNHNGRYDLPGTTCDYDYSGLPFDDIFGDGVPHCWYRDILYPAVLDSYVRRMPYADLNGNGVWDSALTVGTCAGQYRWFWFNNRRLGQLATDSAYQYVSESGNVY